MYQKRPKASTLRKCLNALVVEADTLCQIAMQRSLLWRGLVYKSRRRCGKASCHCAEGAPHVSRVLADRSGKGQRNFSLTGEDLVRFEKLTLQYRKLRQARARLVKLHREMLDLFDRLEAIRREEGVRRYGPRLLGK